MTKTELVHKTLVSTPQYISKKTALYHSLTHSAGKLNSFGLNLADSVRTHQHSWVEVIPYVVVILVAVALQYVSIWQITNRNPAAAQANPQMQAAQKFMPLIFIVFYIVLPAGVGIYFIVSSLFRVAQQEYMYKHDPHIVEAVKQLKQRKASDPTPRRRRRGFVRCCARPPGRVRHGRPWRATPARAERPSRQERGALAQQSAPATPVPPQKVASRAAGSPRGTASPARAARPVGPRRRTAPASQRLLPAGRSVPDRARGEGRRREGPALPAPRPARRRTTTASPAVRRRPARPAAVQTADPPRPSPAGREPRPVMHETTGPTGRRSPASRRPARRRARAPGGRGSGTAAATAAHPAAVRIATDRAMTPAPTQVENHGGHEGRPERGVGRDNR